MAKVIIRIGQSNSAGRAANNTIDNSFKQVFPNIKTWTGAAFSSLDWSTNNNQYPEQTAQGGSEYAILTGLQNHWGGVVYDIKCGIGATYLANEPAQNTWFPTKEGDCFDKSVSAINNGLAHMWNVLGIRVFEFYVFWDQGEADAQNQTNADAYEVNFTNFINDFNSNLVGTGLSDAKRIFINPRISNNITGVAKSTVIQAQTNVAASIPNVYGYSTNSYPLADEFHFTVGGYKSKGEAAVGLIINNNL